MKKYREGIPTSQSRGLKEGLQAYFSSTRCAFQHWNASALCGRSDAAMVSYPLCMDGKQLRNQSLALGQAAPMPCVRGAEIVVWQWEFIVVAMEKLLAILPKDNTCDSGR